LIMDDATFHLDDSQVRAMEGSRESVRQGTLRSWSNFMLRQTRKRFRSQESPEGTRWPPSRFGSHRGGSFSRALYGKGDLFRSLVAYTIDDMTVGVGTNIIYAKTQQEGAQFTATPRQSLWLFHNVFKPAFGKDAGFSWHYHIKIARRRFLGFSGSDVDKLEEIAALNLQKGLLK